VVHLHWGGGTPSILGEERIRDLATALARRFDLSAIGEHAIELDPRYLTPALARTLAAIGVNRASLGVQDFAAHVQRAIGRIQPFELVEGAVELLRQAGIGKINFDLMYGLPNQTLDDVRDTAALAASLRPQRIAVFGYAHVPWLKRHQRLIDESALAPPALRLKQAQAAHQALVELGYEPIGLDHYALPGDELTAAAHSGRLRRNFQGYTTDASETLIGLGASAIGRLPQGYVQNAPDLGHYSRAIESGRFATTRGIALSPDDRLRGHIIERLMCDFECDIDAVLAQSGRNESFEPEFETLQTLAAEGFVDLAGRRITVSDKGRPYLRIIASTFDAYMAGGRARHSYAV
jgi:oxygen-independent coproporphyrinogen-3 oxidase